MSTVTVRRTTRATRPVNENAGRAGRTTRGGDKPGADAVVEKKQAPASKTTSASGPVSTMASNALSAAANLIKKRKALNDNTNAEKKKLLKDRAGKIKEAGKEKETDSAGTSVSGATKLVVELPMRKRRASHAVSKVDEEKEKEKDKPAVQEPATKPTTGTSKRKSTGAARKERVEPQPEPEPEPVHHEEEPEPKRRRSNDRIAVPKEKPEIVEVTQAVPTKVDDNPFDVGLQNDSETIGLGTKQRWDDLDAEDADDPTMVAEYVAEIFEYMKELEVRTMPNPVYMNSQPDLTWEMRGILMDWIIQAHSRFRLLPETLFLATNIIDRFLSMRIVSLVKLQLVGITGLFVAAKYEEIMAPSVQNFLKVSDSGYTEQEILQAEKYILRTIGWDLSYPNPMSWLRRASKADAYDVQTRTMAKFLVEVSVVEEKLLKCAPSLLSAASLWLARLILDREEWNANLEHYSGYSEEALLPCANVMLNYIVQPPSAHESLWKKYSGKKYFKCATYARKWAEQRWPPEPKHSSLASASDEVVEQVEVDLPAALPILREQIAARLEQEAEEAVGEDYDI
ncbi:G2/mitotic-specific cyclin cdc13 [Schizosaccharomyces pombe 972h-] [Rhizoctonia solani]|uniref:G2/mitotic-specific cyclin cdc13 [Schizosaccharomyces pombe 972h-] n=1 Tax=Rhizoctonia solani TaxID=456999 RepID=A0A0K6FMW1_9AGAM|nr:G2/mitotic-specific cyclin cdc13 [Schizosaccharomyces pombe 972h-] [Rhizoctonia solani]